ncbi:hypothetical protein GCM10011492_27080 [Flexivirga endophytica]|uniref:Uncharacterized protein n=1 Tax=Flexivirga endophytica TaxID=1849103 RepID=A0A916T7N1_9MICO|nr:hypothetical protein GCM10011492_27080 [Flexivirga endophytica]GHB42847.1 hypothetical protein GCM10008112_09460 [Flexivirga endophytica]
MDRGRGDLQIDQFALDRSNAVVATQVGGKHSWRCCGATSPPRREHDVVCEHCPSGNVDTYHALAGDPKSADALDQLGASLSKCGPQGVQGPIAFDAKVIRQPSGATNCGRDTGFATTQLGSVEQFRRHTGVCQQAQSAVQANFFVLVHRDEQSAGSAQLEWCATTPCQRGSELRPSTL